MEDAVMTYRCEGNNPTRVRDYPTPDEARAMITGEGGTADYQDVDSLADLLEASECEPPEAEAEDETMVWLNGERTMAESRTIAQREGCCGGCGRSWDCECQGCLTCPQSRMAEGKISAAWAKRQVDLGDADPREMC
jgi:hypothetical protein